MPLERTVKALVLVGGFGTRLRPITYALPKQLIPLAGKPMLYHVLDQLPADIEEVVFASGYKADVLERYLTQHPLRWPTRTVPEATPLGTGGGMRNAGAGLSDPFLVLNSDVIAEIDVPGLIRLHAHRGGVGALSLSEVEDTRPYGVAALGADDRIERFVEKPTPEAAPSHWINAGLSIWRKSVLERIPEGRAVSWETEIVPGLLSEGVFGFRCPGFWEDAGTPERLLHSQRLLFDAGRGGPAKLPDGSRGRGPVAFAPSVRAEGAEFGGYVHLDADVRLGAGSFVEDSILMEGVQVGPNAHVRHAILGPHVRVASDAAVDGEVLASNLDSRAP
ncbi:MAG: NDP-sugar synthase [Thermoplasmata archaeon]|nr:NDP-sugar synthase [Thermoplasmata archaeon]